jgi:hypothetical protein
MNQIGIVQLLLKKCPIKIVQKENVKGTALHIAAQNNNKLAVELLF